MLNFQTGSYDTLRDSASRGAFDQQLRAQEAQQQQQKQAAAAKDRYRQSSPPRRPPPEKSGLSGYLERRAIAIVIALIILGIRFCAGGDSSNETPTPFRFSTPNNSFSFNTPRPVFSNRENNVFTSITCTGYVHEATFGYDSNRISIVTTIRSGTRITYRPTELTTWYELIGDFQSHYIRADSVTSLGCVNASTGASVDASAPSVTSNTATPDVGDVCRVISPSGDSTTVYARPDEGSDEAGQLAASTIFLATRHSNEWFAINGITARQFNGGYVRSSDIDILSCN